MHTIKHFATAETRGMKIMRWLFLTLIVGSIFLFYTMNVAAQTKYVIKDGDSVIVCMSNSSDLKEVVQQAGLQLSDSDQLVPDPPKNSVDSFEIYINRVQMVSVKENGQVTVVGSYGGTVADTLASLDITLSDSDRLSCSLDTETYDGMVIEITRVMLETLEYEEAIPYSTRVFEDSSLEPGTEQVLLAGVDGVNRFTAQITYENGEEVNRTILSQQMVSAPQDAIVLKGVDRSVMEQTFTNTEEYIDSTDYYSYTPPTTEELASDTDTKFVPGTTLPYHTAVRFEATAYTCNSPNYLGNGKTFTGTVARVGAIAVDPDVIPLGTRMYIASADGEYIYGYCVAEDTGSLIHGNIVDLYYDTHDACMEFGRRDIIIYFLD